MLSYLHNITFGSCTEEIFPRLIRQKMVGLAPDAQSITFVHQAKPVRMAIKAGLRATGKEQGGGKMPDKEEA